MSGDALECHAAQLPRPGDDLEGHRMLIEEFVESTKLVAAVMELIEIEIGPGA